MPTLRAFNAVEGMTVMGWFKMTGPNPALNSNTAAPDDRYGAVGLAGVLSGDSDGHAVRGLLEIIEVNGELRLVALGRRVDGASFADVRRLRRTGGPCCRSTSGSSWPPPSTSTTGAMALYRNGQRLDGFYTVPGDPWDLSGPGPHRTSPTDPRGIKIGGSFPQNTAERNPCDCRMDSLMFLDSAVGGDRIRAQYRLMAAR